MRFIACILTCASILCSQPLPGTAPLVREGDKAAQMVDGIVRYLERATGQQIPRRSPSVERLRKILGVVDERVPMRGPELIATLDQPALLARADGFRVYAVRWPVLNGMTAEGLLFQPEGVVKARVVTLPDASQLPEQLAVSQLLAASGCQVLSPVLISRENTWSGNPRIRITKQPHREYIYRMAFMVGRSVLGYEVQKVMAAVDWFAAQSPKLPIGVWGYGEGGGVALFSAALDNRITVAAVSGYFEPREGLWRQPIYRNVFGLLKDFGDAELASMIRPRTLIVDSTAGPAVSAAEGATPGTLVAASLETVRKECERAGGAICTLDGSAQFLTALALERHDSPAVSLDAHDAGERQHRQVSEMVEITQRLARDSDRVRDELWSKSQPAVLRAKLWDEVLGKLPPSTSPLNVRTAKSYSGAGWDAYDVVYDVLPDVIGYGVLLVPGNVPAGDRRPVVVAQHGLDGRPQGMFGLKEDDANRDFHYYQNIGSRLADRGYIVYLPQNPYIGDFRRINRLANPLGLSMFSFILAQHDRLLDWLTSLPYVDPARIGFYGLSYGGKTALRVPPLLDRYALSICSGDFNEWIHKLVSVDDPQSYMYTNEYEMPEFDLANVASHAEMAKLMAPRPFMVERGHRDAVGSDEWVAYEYAKVKRFYDEAGIGERTAIEYFNGPHQIHGVGTLEFLRRFLGR
jgi:dienelactone hydrolase